MKHFIMVDDYEISPDWKRPPRSRELVYGMLAMYALRKYLKSQKAKKGKKSSGGSTGGRRWMPDARQNCVVKMHYSKSMAAHLEQLKKYLSREGTSKEGGRADLYGTSVEEYQSRMVAKNFRIFLSPEKPGVPLKPLVNRFVKRLEIQSGLKLDWLAAEHYNTAHPHAHLLINGRDKDGRDVFFSRELVKTVMREIARDICTSLIGSRTREEMAKAKQNQIVSNRYTRIDDNMKALIVGLNIEPNSLGKNKETYIARLDYLRTLGLCSWKGGQYHLEKDWDLTLKTMGRYSMFLDARKNLIYTDKNNFELYQGYMGPKKGMVSKVYKIDEVSDNYAIVLEGGNGRGYFIPLFVKPTVTKGDCIQYNPKKNEKGRYSGTIGKITEEELIMSYRDGPKTKLIEVLISNSKTKDGKTRG